MNNSKVRDRDHFYQLLRYAPPCANIEVIRGDKLPETDKQDKNIPPEREKLIDRHAGFEYFVCLNLFWIVNNSVFLAGSHRCHSRQAFGARYSWRL